MVLYAHPASQLRRKKPDFVETGKMKKMKSGRKKMKKKTGEKRERRSKGNGEKESPACNMRVLWAKQNVAAGHTA